MKNSIKERNYNNYYNKLNSAKIYVQIFKK